MTISVQVRPVAKYVYDCFFGEGYDTWSRIRKNHWGVSVVAGQRLGAGVCRTLNNIVMDHPRGSYEAFTMEE